MPPPAKTDGAEGAAVDGEGTPTAKNPKATKKVKFPCGKCDGESTGNTLCCNVCEQWFHQGCVDGMTKEFFENCKKGYELWGVSAFLCKICRKVWTAIKKSLKGFGDEMKEMANRITVLELEKESLAEKVERIEMKAERATERVVGVEKEVASGMEKAKEEVKIDVQTEMVHREEQSNNFVIYGLDETKEDDAAKWKEEEERKVKELMGKIGVNGEVVVKFRAGKKRAEGEKPRPVIVKAGDDEIRMNVFKNAPRLSRLDTTKRVYIAPDMTWQQREEERKKEVALREEAEKKTQEERNQGSGKKYIVVGARGRRRIVEVEERAVEAV